MGNAVIASALIVGGTTALRVAYDPKVGNKPAAYGKIAVGVFAYGAVMTLVAGTAPSLATVIAVTLTIAALFINGAALSGGLQHVLGK